MGASESKSREGIPNRIEIESKIEQIQPLVQSSTDLGRILNLFSDLADTSEGLISDHDLTSVEKVFLSIEPKIQWHDHPEKNEDQRSFYGKMAKIYCLNQSMKALDCYATLLKELMKKTTPSNYSAYDAMIKSEFHDGQWLGIELRAGGKYYELTDFMHDYFENQNYPKACTFYLFLLDGKTHYYRENGHYQRAIELEEMRINAVNEKKDKKPRDVLEPNMNIAFCYHSMGRPELCLEKCLELLNEMTSAKAKTGFKNVHDYGQLVYAQIKALFYKAISLTELNNPAANKAFQDLIDFKEIEPTGIEDFEFVEVNDNMWHCAKHHLKKEPYMTMITKANQATTHACELFESGQFQKAFDAAKEARFILKMLIRVTTQESAQLFVKASFYGAASMSELGFHTEALKICGQFMPWIQHIDIEKVVITYEDARKLKEKIQERSKANETESANNQ